MLRDKGIRDKFTTVQGIIVVAVIAVALLLVFGVIKIASNPGGDTPIRPLPREDHRPGEPVDRR
ncbi:hypothetical protein [Nocardia camponoti]|uniref:hypothetical protein n=1 Tax=Nocardia camponoti TaxID=1616106 RepID=UPI001666C1C6|nr:hypothetical protein [Nocardia camponoti]